MDGVAAVRVDYTEIGRPTVIRQAGTGRDMPASGSFWLDPSTGRILKSAVSTSDGLFTMETTVVFRISDKLGISVPAEMREYYSTAKEKIFGKATYGNFRRFQVKTEETIR